MKSLIAFLCIALAPASLAWSQEKEPSEEELRQRCERDLNCARRNSTTDTEFVANATDPELCKGGLRPARERLLPQRQPLNAQFDSPYRLQLSSTKH